MVAWETQFFFVRSAWKHFSTLRWILFSLIILQVVINKLTFSKHLVLAILMILLIQMKSNIKSNRPRSCCQAVVKVLVWNALVTTAATTCLWLIAATVVIKPSHPNHLHCQAVRATQAKRLCTKRLRLDWRPRRRKRKTIQSTSKCWRKQQLQDQ